MKKLLRRKRAFSLFILIQALNIFSVISVTLGCSIIANKAIIHFDDKTLAAYYSFKWMILYPLLLIIILLLLAKILIRKITEPLRSLLDYLELLSQGKIEMPIPSFSTPNQEINSLDEKLARVVSFVRQRLNVLEQESETDPLTGLANRRTLELVFSDRIRVKDHFAVLMIDIDFFKVVNDTYGHGIGDEVLCFIAEMMRSVSREGDLSCRFGGEEFIILLMNADTRLAKIVAERLRKKIASTLSPTGKPVTVSIGITDNSDQISDPKSLLERADKALYQAKKLGRNRTIIEPASDKK